MDNHIYSLAKLIVIGMAVQLMVIGYVFYQSYEGRVNLVTSQQRGCERGKLDRDANAKGWRSLGASDVARDLESRSKIDCTKAFPKASVIP